MKYDFNIQEANYPCIHKLLEDILDNLNIGSDEFTSVTVVSNEELTRDLLRLFLSIEVDDFDFNPEILDFDTIDYDDLYYFDVTNNGEISVTKAWLESNKYHDDMYAILESDVLFVYADDINEDLVDIMSDNNTVIFDFDEDGELFMD